MLCASRCACAQMHGSSSADEIAKEGRLGSQKLKSGEGPGSRTLVQNDCPDSSYVRRNGAPRTRRLDCPALFKLVLQRLASLLWRPQQQRHQIQNLAVALAAVALAWACGFEAPSVRGNMAAMPLSPTVGCKFLHAAFIS